MSLVRTLLPIAAVIAAISAVTLFLLNDGNSIGTWLLAGLILAHGWVHLVFAFPRPPAEQAAPGGLAYPFDFGRSWLITRAGLGAGLVRGVGLVLMVAVFVVHLLAALATVAIVVPTDLWPALVTVAALGSALLLALFYSPLLLLGFAIDAALLWLVLSEAWRPA